jgi:hypothetical protein
MLNCNNSVNSATIVNNGQINNGLFISPTNNANITSILPPDYYAESYNISYKCDAGNQSPIGYWNLT